MKKFIETFMKIKSKLEKDGIVEKLKGMEKRLRPSAKTLFTFAWIAISLMAGEIIIYNHQAVFSSYSLSASDFYPSRTVAVATNEKGRISYEAQRTSADDFYRKIIARAASDAGGDISKAPVAKASQRAIVPAAKRETAVAQARPSQTRSGGDVVLHRVKKGETLKALSKQYYRTTARYSDIARANNLKPPYSIKAGDKLLIVKDK